MLASWEWYSQLGMFDMYLHPASSRGGRSAWWWYAMLKNWPAFRSYRLYRQMTVGYNSQLFDGGIGFFLVVIRILIQRFFYLRFRYWYVTGAPYPEAPLLTRGHYMDCMRIAHYDMGLGPKMAKTPSANQIWRDPEFTGYYFDLFTNPASFATLLLFEISLYILLALSRPSQLGQLADVGLQLEPTYVKTIMVAAPSGDIFIEHLYEDTVGIPVLLSNVITKLWLQQTWDDDESDF